MPAVYSGRRVSDSLPRSAKVYISFDDDVGRLADAAREQLGELEDRRRHLAIAVEARHVARRVDDVRKAPVLVGEEVVRATHGLHLAHGKSP